MNYKVFIASAGIGSRINSLCKNLNKSLITVNNKPVISHILEKFDNTTEIIIAVGYKKDVLKQYLSLVHSDKNIKVVEIDNYDGAGSGLGHTLLCCEKYLQSPFIFIPNDTIVLDDIPVPKFNWVGYAQNDKGEYRKLLIKNGYLVDLLEKDSQLDTSYIGLCGIHDFANFWDTMKDGRNYGAVSIGESFAIKKMITKFSPIKFRWYDVGCLDGLNLTRTKLNKNSFSILEKNNEDIWFVDNKVIKYFENTDLVKGRVGRSKAQLGKYLPSIIDYSNNIFIYEKVAGNTLSNICNKNIFVDFLSFMEQLWSEEVSPESINCYDFYYTKTLGRIELYLNRYLDTDDAHTINGEVVPSLNEILSKVNWDVLCKPTPALIHGDLHFENVIFSETGSFTLIDWRDGFGESKNTYDIFYDFAKLLHGLIISHKIVHEQLYSFYKEDNNVLLDILMPNSYMGYIEQFKSFIQNNSYDWRKVQILTGLIFINNAPLHDEQYANFLFYFGKKFLWDILNE